MDSIHRRNGGRVSGMSIPEKTFTRQQGIVVSAISQEGWGDGCGEDCAGWVCGGLRLVRDDAIAEG